MDFQRGIIFVRTNTLDALREILEPDRDDALCVVADLTLGSWTPHAIETQWLGQIIGKDIAYRGDADVGRLQALGEAMSAGIDDEARGNRSLIGARSAACQMARVLRQRPVRPFILAPSFGVPWRSDDRLFVEYLLEVEPDLSLTIVQCNDHASPWLPRKEVTDDHVTWAPRLPSPHAVVHLIPTAISPTVLERLDETEQRNLIWMRNGWALVAPEYRRGAHGGFGASERASLTALGLDRFRAYAQIHGKEPPSDMAVLCAEAWRQCHSGYPELGIVYMVAAEACAPDQGTRLAMTSQKQAMRIATSQYRAAGEEPDAVPEPFGSTRGILLGMKGWGLVMNGDALAALPYLEQALEICAADGFDKTHLLFMNITALARLRSGDSAGALALEKKIESLLASFDDGAYEILYVNCLNLARLHRYAGNFEQSESYYLKAFSTCEGGRSETDVVNINLCMAKLSEDRGRYEEALIQWVRAAMQWCANQSPEALNWRVQALVIGQARRIAVSGVAEARELVETLSAGFLDKLQALAPRCGVFIEIDLNDVPKPFLSTNDKGADVVPVAYVGADGWSVLAAKGGQPASRLTGPLHVRLIRWLNRWVERQSGNHEGTCYVIDRTNGVEMPRNLPETISSAISAGARCVHYAGSIYPLDSDPARKSYGQKVIRLNPFVSRIEEDDSGAIVYYKRYRRPSRLSSAEWDIVRALKSAEGQESLAAFVPELGGVPDVVTSLMKKAVIQLDVAVAAAPESQVNTMTLNGMGTSLPLSTIRS